MEYDVMGLGGGGWGRRKMTHHLYGLLHDFQFLKIKYYMILFI
jgi:hypothetical protein